MAATFQRWACLALFRRRLEVADLTRSTAEDRHHDGNDAERRTDEDEVEDRPHQEIVSSIFDAQAFPISVAFRSAEQRSFGSGKADLLHRSVFDIGSRRRVYRQNFPVEFLRIVGITWDAEIFAKCTVLYDQLARNIFNDLISILSSYICNCLVNIKTKMAKQRELDTVTFAGDLTIATLRSWRGFNIIEVVSIIQWPYPYTPRDEWHFAAYGKHTNDVRASKFYSSIRSPDDRYITIW